MPANSTDPLQPMSGSKEHTRPDPIDAGLGADAFESRGLSSYQHDPLKVSHAVDTPENVVLGYEIVGPGHRFIAALIDSTLIAAVFAALIMLLVAVMGAIGEGGEASFIEGGSDSPAGWMIGAVYAVFAILSFGILWGYYLFFEWLWRGQTPGKRYAGIRVVAADGQPIGFNESLIRNLVRIVDYLPGAYMLGLITMLIDGRSRRLGDMAAGTIVIRERERVSLEHIRESRLDRDQEELRARQRQAARESLLASSSAYDFRRLRPEDRSLLYDTMTRLSMPDSALPEQVIVSVAGALAARMGGPMPARGAEREFLRQLLDAVGEGELGG